MKGIIFSLVVLIFYLCFLLENNNHKLIDCQSNQINEVKILIEKNQISLDDIYFLLKKEFELKQPEIIEEEVDEEYKRIKTLILNWFENINESNES